MDKKLLKQWEKDEKAPFIGWDFSYLDSRLKEDEFPWNYLSMARRLVKESRSLLDMGTGGGELFSKLSPFPKHTAATEGYKPNYLIAKKRLEPLGVGVVYNKNVERMPFEDGEFEVVLNRHSAFDAKEVYRILGRCGKFLTQQVEGSNLADLKKEFGINNGSRFNFQNVKSQIVKSGLKIKMARKWSGKIVFKDVGAIVYFLRAVPWIVEGFSVKAHLPYLEKLRERACNGQKLAFTQKRLIILAEKQNVADADL